MGTWRNRLLVAGMAMALALGMAAQSAPLGIVVPAYFYPSAGGYWNGLNFAAPLVPLIAIMNPNSGPGASKDNTYVQALSKLHQAGGQVIGYVHTSYATRALADVEADIDLYYSFYAIDGIFIDEMTNDADTNHIEYYAAIYQYIKAKGAGERVFGNPGSNTQEAYLDRPTDDALMIFEDNGTNYVPFTPSSWVFQYPAQQFIHLPYGVPTAATMSNDVALAVSRNAGWIYITDDALPNPYDTLPTYWTNEVNLVHALNGGGVPVTILTQPASQTAVVGRAVTFTVGAFGSSPLSYQWFAGTNAVPNATNAFCTLDSVQLTNAGMYSVQVSNAVSSTNSLPALLTVQDTTSHGVFKRITIDGSFLDWTGVPVVYTAAEGPAGAIQYKDVYLANDETNLYIRCTLYSTRPNAFANSYDNLFIDADANAATGYSVAGGSAGVGSEMLVQWGSGFQEKHGGFNEGAVNNLGWALGGSADSTDFEFSISRAATDASDATTVFVSNTIAILLEGDDTGYNSVEFAPPVGGLIYTFAGATPGALSISYSSGNVSISWVGAGTLQSCGSLDGGGAWTNVPAAGNPYVVTPSNTEQFFRLILSQGSN